MSSPSDETSEVTNFPVTPKSPTKSEPTSAVSTSSDAPPKARNTVVRKKRVPPPIHQEFSSIRAQTMSDRTYNIIVISIIVVLMILISLFALYLRKRNKLSGK